MRSHVNSRARAIPRARSCARKRRIAEQPLERVRERRRVAGRTEQPRVADELGERGRVRGDDRRAAGHRLEHLVAEALVEARVEEGGGALVELDEPLVRDAADELDAVGGGAAPAARDDERSPAAPFAARIAVAVSSRGSFEPMWST